jgi:hypothetical protein
VGDGHFLAFVGTALTRIGATLAVVDLVFTALFAASAADFRAKAADVLREFRSASHETCGDAADDRALMVQVDAARHHFDVVFLQAGGGAMFALGGAFVAGFDTILVRCRSAGSTWLTGTCSSGSSGYFVRYEEL